MSVSAARTKVFSIADRTRRTRRTRRTFAVLAAACIGALALVACESAANLDVTYRDTSKLQGDAGADGEAAAATPATFSACPCDESEGMGCCLVGAGQPSYCTGDTALCKSEQGMHLRCAHPDPSTESVCCWHLGAGGGAKGAITAYASACDGGVPACTTDSDCFGTAAAKCATRACNGVTIGACAKDPPPCF